MEPEDVDMKARSANEYSIPPFENEAWDKMELLLNQHLPKKKEKQRIFIWWFAAVIAIGSMGYYLTNYSSILSNTGTQNSILTNKKNTTPSLAKPTPTTSQNINKTNLHKASLSTLTPKKLKVEVVAETVDNPMQKLTHATGFLLKNTNDVRFKKNKITKQSRVSSEPLLQTSLLSTVDNLPPFYTNKTLRIKVNGKPGNDNEIVKAGGKLPSTNNGVLPAEDTIATKKIKEINEKSTAVGVNKTAVKSNQSNNHFYLTLAAGVEANGTSFLTGGAAAPIFGAGVQYTRGKLFFRTGVMVTKKLYVANDKDYNRRPGSWMSNVTFNNIEANCKMIEVPVSVGYTVVRKKRTSAYVMAGTSAFFIKKEDYQFYFKNQSGNDITRSVTFTNNSNHYFSSLNLSAGIEQKISNRLSIMAEPTIKIPLGGIGFGKVKVYSAGLLITAKIKLK